MIGELLGIAEQCDGVRCDMAMLVLPDVFERTWGRRSPPSSGPKRHGECEKKKLPSFRFMAEVYWDLEWTMLQQGFDYAYDKRLYDRLREGQARPVREASPAPGSIIRPSSQGSSKTMTSRELLRPSRRECTRPQPSSRIYRPACDSFTRGSSKVEGERISPHLVRAPIEPCR